MQYFVADAVAAVAATQIIRASKDSLSESVAATAATESATKHCMAATVCYKSLKTPRVTDAF